ncbi:ABC transporter permease [Paenibacillus sp. L3-i20]|uniref:ABC transporter permease n=1 Tax=Paenibacillus sp. L3-i20 TaxID=2905833 RepID=UPI001EDCE546|nr:ABC transporter permease [Paenibacillus sp. L3-i20]GKU77275.1 ABC transporter permease [Paenibacillus sp. L3-i20]
MTFSMNRVMAILQKDYKDVSRNLYVSTTIIVPLILALFYGKSDDITIDAHYMIINLTFIMVGAYIQSALVAEEKEKNTLRGLTLSPASIYEIFLGKSLLSMLATGIILYASIRLLGYNPANMAVVLVGLLLSLVFYVGIGTFVGLLTKSVMEASVAIMPCLILFTWGSSLITFADSIPALKAVTYLPNVQLVQLAEAVEKGAGFAGVWSNLIVIALWIVVIYSLCVYLYKKRMVDA